jgi:hypothetical protein
MSRLVLRLLPLVLVGGAFLVAPSEAHARRGIVPFVVNTGAAVKNLGEPTAEAKELIRGMTGKDLSVGYLYSRFGLLWLNIWTWDGQYALYEESGGSINYEALTREQAAELMGVDPEKIGPPLGYTVPPGLLVYGGGIVLLVLVAMRTKKKEAAERQQLVALFEDARYKRALEIIGERSAANTPDAAEQSTPTSPARQTPDDGGFGEAIDYLVAQGVEREEAERNLGRMLQVILSRQQASE